MKTSPFARFLSLWICLVLTSPVFGAEPYVVGSQSPDISWAPLTQKTLQQQLDTLGDLDPRHPMDPLMAASAQMHKDTLLNSDVLPSPDSSAVSLSPALLPGGLASSAASSNPPVLNSLANAVSFVLGQRYSFPDGTKGLPADFSVPSSLSGQILDNNPDADRLVREGSDLYDNSLAIIALLDSRDMSDAQSLINIYMQPTYGTMDLRAEPNANNGGAFAPFGPNAFYLFSFVRANGSYQDLHAADPTAWQYYSPDTGENAWLVLAIAQYVRQAEAAGASASSLQTYINFAASIGNGMVALQNPANDPSGITRDYTTTQGCIPSTPKGVFDASGHNYNPNDVCYVENNLSAYAALGALSAIVTDPLEKQAFQVSRAGIASWLQDAQIYVPGAVSGRSVSPSSSSPMVRGPVPRPPSSIRPPSGLLTGLMDPKTGLFYQGVIYNPSTKQWDVFTDNSRNHNPILATDSGGTWAISALGPQLIDQMGGVGAAERMYESVRALNGRTATQAPDGTITSMQSAGATGRLDGFDFGNLYPGQSMISPEWTGGAINAVKQLQSYYGSGSPAYAGLSSDLQSMQAFLGNHTNSYAVGPGLGGSRMGNTGFGWQSPPAAVTAMASIYSLLTQDPLAAARSGF